MSAEINKTIWLLLQLRLSHSQQTGELRCGAAARFLIILNLSYGRVCRLITLAAAAVAAAGGCGTWSAGARTQFDL